MRCLFKPLPLLMDARVRMSTRASPCAPHLYSACMCVGRYIQERSDRVRRERKEQLYARVPVVTCSAVYTSPCGPSKHLFSLPRPPKYRQMDVPPYWWPYRERGHANKQSRVRGATCTHTHPVNLEIASPASPQCDPLMHITSVSSDVKPPVTP